MSAVPRDRPAELRNVASARMPTRWGHFRALAFDRERPDGRVESAFALVMGEVAGPAPLVRLHSQCTTGERWGSLRCDCGGQLELAMRRIAAEGRGILVYDHEEGRGMGLTAKLQAYALQDAGLDTVTANLALGHAVDARDYGLPVAILRELGVRQVRLMSNNPLKFRALAAGGIEVVERVACEIAPTPHSVAYLRAKKERMGHDLTSFNCAPGRTSSPPRPREA